MIMRYCRVGERERERERERGSEEREGGERGERLGWVRKTEWRERERVKREGWVREGGE